MIHRTFHNLLLANVNENETENEKGIRNGSVELRSGNAIEANSGIVNPTKVQALVAMEHTLLDLLEGLAQVVEATNIIIQVLIVMLQIIQVGRCRRGWDSERMESYHYTEV